jgi:hypothetical protein
VVTIGRESSGSKYAWEGKMLYQAATLEQKVNFADRYVDIFEFLGEDTESYEFFGTD